MFIEPFLFHSIEFKQRVFCIFLERWRIRKSIPNLELGSENVKRYFVLLLQ